MTLLKPALAIVLLSITTSSLAINGYKDFKFGMTPKEAMSLHKCKWEKLSEKMPRILEQVYSCNKYKFNKENVSIYLAFSPDKKLVRVAIDNIPESMSLDVIQGLKEKYTPTSMPTEQEVQNAKKGSKLKYKFNNGDVIFTVTFEPDYGVSYGLLYTETPTTLKIREYSEKKKIDKTKKLKDEL